METVIIIAIVTLMLCVFLAGAFWLCRWNRGSVHWEAEKVVQLLRSIADKDPDYESWDYFQACPIKNPQLESVRQDCLEMLDEGSPYLVSNEEPLSLALNQPGIEKIKTIIDKCSKEHNMPLQSDAAARRS